MSFRNLAEIFALFLTLGQAGVQSVAGTWTMDFRGQTFARLELQADGGALSGRISLGAVHVNEQGEIDEVLKPASNFTPLFDIVYRDGVLSFARKDGDDTDRFELRVVNPAGDTAQLAFLLTEEFRRENQIPAPKPVTMRRIRP
jgi:hypothetical protein